jgi:DNA-binding NarL/FixJ family response regulator
MRRAVAWCRKRSNPAINLWLFRVSRASPAMVPLGVAVTTPITVLVADDNPRVHGLVRRILGEDYRIVGEVVSGEAMLECVERLLPDVLVVDISMPGISGIEAVRRIQMWRPPVVVFLTSHGDPVTVRHALAAGGTGFVLKPYASEELPQAVASALRNEAFVSPAIYAPREFRPQAPGIP